MYESSRVKGLSYHDGYLASISSAGDVTIWSVDIPQRNITELCAINIGCRPTCVTILDLSKFDKEYVLKIEGDDEYVENQISDEDEEQSKVGKLKPNATSGRVVIEVETDDNKNRKAKKATKTQIAHKNTVNGKSQKDVLNSGENSSCLSTKKTNNNNVSGFNEEDVTESSQKILPIGKVNKRKMCKNVAEKTAMITRANPTKLNFEKKLHNKLNKTISSFNDGIISSPAAKKAKKSKLSLA